MKKVCKQILAALFFTISFSILAAEYSLDVESLNKPQAFLSHSGPGQWDNYLVMNLPFAPIAEVFKQVIIDQKRAMTSRGEAHITVVTPVEFWNVLRPVGMTIEMLNTIAQASKIQQANFQVICLGQGASLQDSKVEKTFFVVVQSEDLVKIRQRVQQVFISKGGNPKDFDPLKYYPHITVGFTKRDLHEKDGVIKDQGSCIFQL